tara:strand:+ start:1004 stop:1288 length:285 start_codon:yes stop_codon:yes gene_type:complete
MNKLNLEYTRLGLAFFSFIGIISFLFAYINQFDVQWFQIIGELVTIPILIIIIINPIWMMVDLIKKNIADKAIFNLTLFLSVISIGLLGFMMLL